jgi:glutamyl-tRNA(Gln) amidotransferase subunit D
MRRRRDDREVTVIKDGFEEKVSRMVYYYPAMQPDIIDALVDKRVPGHRDRRHGAGSREQAAIPGAETGVRLPGVHVYMTVQTLWGYVQMYVYETGREIMELGVIPAANMLPEVAYVKLAWALGQTDDREEVRRLMLTPDRRRDHDPRAVQRLPDLPGGDPRGAGVPSLHQALIGCSLRTSKAR